MTLEIVLNLLTILENPVKITENPWNYQTFRNPLKCNVLLELSNHWNLLKFTGTNIARAMVQKRSKISQNGQNSISNIAFGSHWVKIGARHLCIG